MLRIANKSDESRKAHLIEVTVLQSHEDPEWVDSFKLHHDDEVCGHETQHLCAPNGKIEGFANLINLVMNSCRFIYAATDERTASKK